MSLEGAGIEGRCRERISKYVYEVKVEWIGIAGDVS